MKAMIAGLLLVSASSAVAGEKVVPAEPETHPNWSEVRAEGEALLKDKLVDPESAQIAWTRGFEWRSWKQGNLGFANKRRYGWIACGTLNAKNRMGGYAGREKVVMTVEADGTRRAGMAYNVDSHCSYDAERVGEVVPELK